MAVTGKGALRVAIEDFIENNPLGKSIKGWVTSLIEMIEKAVFGEYRQAFNMLNKTQGLEGMFDEAKLTSGSGLHQGSIFSLGGFANSLGSNAASTLFGPYFRLLNYQIDHNLHTTRLDPSASIAGFWRDPVYEAMLANDLGDLGWSKERVEVLTKLMRPRLNQTELIALMLRGIVSQADFSAEMRRRGYLDEDIQGMINLSTVIPNIQDIITMSVREAWSEDTVRRFNYDEGLPGEVGEWAAKQGLSADWVKRYWRAHWNLPSPTQAFEMLHRLRPGISKNPFTKDDLMILLKTADYPEYFRGRLMDISYNPLTRVDVRRMYGEGVLSEKEVHEAYLDIGYDENNAKFLTEFTVKYESQDTDTIKGKKKALSKDTFIQGYILGVIDETTLRDKLARIPLKEEDIEFEVSIAKIKMSTGNSVNYKQEYNRDLKTIVEKEYSIRFIDKSQASTLLQSIGMIQEDIDNCLKLADYKYNASVIDNTLASLEVGYINDTIDYNTVVSTMGKIGLSGASQDALVTQWKLVKEAKVKPLTEAQYRAAFKKSILTADEYKTAISALGYSSKDVDILVKLYTESDDTSQV